MVPIIEMASAIQAAVADQSILLGTEGMVEHPFLNILSPGGACTESISHKEIKGNRCFGGRRDGGGVGVDLQKEVEGAGGEDS